MERVKRHGRWRGQAVTGMVCRLCSRQRDATGSRPRFKTTKVGKNGEADIQGDWNDCRRPAWTEPLWYR